MVLGDISDTQINNPSLNLVVVNSDDIAKISKLYEREIGALTPLVADSIQDAVKEYPTDWIEEAIQVAAQNNSRHWNDILSVLKNCKASGKRLSLNDFTLQNNAEVVLVSGDSQTLRLPDSGDTALGDMVLDDTSDTQINNPSFNLVVVNSDGLKKISKLYEREIGALTPLVADSIQDAVKEYPPDWIEEAIQLAVQNNSRRWNYVLAILKNCKASGKRPSLNKLEKTNETYKQPDKRQTNPVQQRQPTQADIEAARRVKARKQAQSSPSGM